MDKKKLIAEIENYLNEELITITASAKSAYEAATHPDSRAEDQYDTRGLEASYLAGAQAERASEIKRQLLIYKYLPVRAFGDNDVICPGALAELELNGKRAFYFLVPQGGGLITQVDGVPVQVITPHSPMGEALLGRKTGDLLDVEIRDTVREYRVISVS